MRSRAFWTAAAAAVVLLGVAGAGVAAEPSDPAEKRIQGVEKQLRQLREIVLQAKDTGQPVQVRVTAEPDPELAALQSRVDDLEQAARTRNDQIDGLTHDLDVAKRDAADARSQVKALEERLARIEGRQKAIDDNQAATAAAGATEYASPPSAPPPSSMTLRATEGAGADDSFRHAKQLLLQGQYAAASGAFQSFVDTYGDTPNGPEARYWLGETLYIRGLYPDAATAYIGAIRGWPQTSWAPDAVVKLARALVALNKPMDACRTLDEFTRRYPAAGPGARTRAASVRAAAKCGGPAAAG